MRLRLVLFMLVGLLVACQPTGHVPTLTATPRSLVGQPIKAADDGTVYRLMEDGQIRHIQDWPTFLALGYEPNAIREVPPEQLATYPLGMPLTRWLTSPTDQNVYFLFKGERYRVRDAAALHFTGGTSQDVVQVTDTFLHRFPLVADDVPEAFPSVVLSVAEDNETATPVTLGLAWKDLPVFPSPTADYEAWLRAWPRPDGDNGRCIHYLQMPAGDAFEVRYNIARMLKLNMRWVLVNYTSPTQLVQMAPIFKQAGLMVVWRPFVRPYQSYDWAADVAFLRTQGIPPYIQVYNEPSLPDEWDGQILDQDIYLANLVRAADEIDAAGGYVGLQNIQPDWLQAALQRLRAERLDRVFERLFFVPHPYGANHPPEYDEDITSVLGFTVYADVFRNEIGFVPVMIAGEGGWRPGQTDDPRYPMVSEALHRDYHVAVYDWFRSGRLSNGDPLPDYLFAFCPWLLSDPDDPAAWFDSRSGDRQFTLAAVASMPTFVRRFTWERN